MKKRLLAGLIALAMTFSLVACKGEENPTTTPQNNPGVEGQEPGGDGTEGVEPNGDPVDEGACKACGKPEPWTGACNCVAINAFNEKQGDRGDRTLINVYTFTHETADMLNFFLDENPDFADEYYLQLEYNVEASAHRMAVSLAIDRKGDDGIDLFVADVDYAVEFAELGGTASIKDLGIEINESEYYPYTLDLMRVGGNIMALSHQATPGAMYYRADVAADVFGIESEDEMQKLVSDWDGFLDAAQQIMDWAEEEDNGFKILAGADELKRNFLNARDEAWLDGDTFNVDFDTISEFVDVTTEIMDMGGLAVKGSTQWGSDWYDGMKDGVFAYFGSTWYLHYTLRPNAEGGPSVGNWGMIPGPQEFFWGGTYWYGSKNAAADDVKAEAVRTIIEFFCVNDDTLKAYMESTGDFPSKKAVAKELAEEYDGNDFFLYNTNHLAVFAVIAEKIDVTKNVTKFDDVFNSLFDDFINQVFADDVGMEEALDNMEEGVRERLPSVEVR